jgi:hypothetical protein
MNHLNFRQSNFVDYQGQLGHYDFSFIKELKKHNEDDFIFWLEHPKVKNNKFVGYSAEIREVYLKDSHLVNLGFSYDAKENTYNYKQIKIGRYGYADGKDPMHLTWVSSGWVIIPTDLSIPNTKEEYNKKTIPIPTIHSLQNYLTDARADLLDFSKLRI